jgi:hypothetical protein
MGWIVKVENKKGEVKNFSAIINPAIAEIELKKLFEIEKAGPNTYFVEPSADFEIANILGMYFESQSID